MFAGTEATAPLSSSHVPEAHDLKELFIKLRWMGMDSEAEHLSHLLPPDEALVGPIDTD